MNDIRYDIPGAFECYTPFDLTLENQGYVMTIKYSRPSEYRITFEISPKLYHLGMINAEKVDNHSTKISFYFREDGDYIKAGTPFVICRLFIPCDYDSYELDFDIEVKEE